MEQKQIVIFPKTYTPGSDYSSREFALRFVSTPTATKHDVGIRGIYFQPYIPNLVFAILKLKRDASIVFTEIVEMS